MRPRILRRCRMLLLADQDVTDADIAEEIGCSLNCVSGCRKRYVQYGLSRALYDAPRSGARPKFTDEQLQAITEMAASNPPEGKKRWTIELICKEAVRREIVESISSGTVYALLKSHDNPPRQK